MTSKTKSSLPKAVPGPPHKPTYRKRPTAREEKILRSLGKTVDDYLNFAVPKSGKPKHRFIRALFTLYRKTAPSLFIQTVERACKYRITDIKVVENITALILIDGSVEITTPEIDQDFQKREAYIEGCFAVEVDLSIYDIEAENDEQMAQMLKYFRLGGLLAHWVRYLGLAQKGRYSHVRLLEYIIAEEYQIKKENAHKMRINRARMPEKFVLETFPFNRQPKLNKKKIVGMYDAFDYMSKCRNIIFIGRQVWVRTGLATAFLNHAINKGYNGQFIPFPDLVERLYQSVADHSDSKIIKKFFAYDCLLIDELGYVEVELCRSGCSLP